MLELVRGLIVLQYLQPEDRCLLKLPCSELSFILFLFKKNCGGHYIAL